MFASPSIQYSCRLKLRLFCRQAGWRAKWQVDVNFCQGQPKRASHKVVNLTFKGTHFFKKILQNNLMFLVWVTQLYVIYWGKFCYVTSNNYLRTHDAFSSIFPRALLQLAPWVDQKHLFSSTRLLCYFWRWIRIFPWQVIIGKHSLDFSLLG